MPRSRYFKLDWKIRLFFLLYKYHVYTYILFSDKTQKFYIGSCENMDSRLARHNTGATPSTKSGRPWTVVYFELFPSKTEALAWEKYIKSMKSKYYIQKLIETSLR